MNVRGMGSKEKRQTVFGFFRSEGYDIICLQETHTTLKDVNVWEREWGGQIVMSHGSSNSRGTAILIAKKRGKILSDVTSHDQGRFNIVRVKLVDLEFTLCNLYGPNLDDESLFSEISALLNKDVYKHEIMMIGDFNVALDPKMDRKNKTQPHPKVAEAVQTLIQEFRLTDPWRDRHPNDITYSWQRNFSILAASRIDYSLVSGGLNNLIRDTYYVNGVRTDHQGIVLLIYNVKKRGAGIWRFNNMLLNDTFFCEGMAQLLDDKLKKYQDVHPITRWEAIKCDIYKYSLNYAKEKAAAKKVKLNSWLNESAQLQTQINFGNHTNDQLARLALLQRQINDYYSDKAQAAAFRARAKWTGEGEKNSKFFFSLEKSNFNAKTITALSNEMGDMIECPHAILNELSQFYGNLYRSNPEVHFRLENKSNVLINPTDAALLDASLTEYELKTALCSMQLNKAPGCDGISVDFYKKFWPQLSKAFFSMAKSAMENGNMPDSAMKGVISLLPKKGKDPLKVRNWRPLTLLNNDYKIISKALALRLKSTLNQIISEDQTGFMEGRQISVSVRKVFDAIEYLESQQKGGYILSLDYVKCFDKIEIDAILGSLLYFGFGVKFTKMVEILQRNFQSCVINNGYVSPWFEVTRSTHQGDPLAPYLFLLCGETLAHLIKQHPNIAPLEIYGVKELISQFADDTQLFEPENQESLQATLESMRTIQNNVGLELNHEKTSIHMIGNCNKVDLQSPLLWTKEYPTVLGISTDPSSNQLFDTLEKGKKILQSWRHRSLTLMGKVLVVNTLFASLFVYLLQVISDPPTSFYVAYDDIIKSFIWGDTKEKIRLRTLQCLKHQGGLKLCNMLYKMKSLRINWIFRGEKYVHKMLNVIIPKSLGPLFWDANIEVKDLHLFINHDAPTFWKEICYHWFDYKGIEEVAPNHILWCNSKIKIDGNPFLWPECANRGLMYINQLLDESDEWLEAGIVQAHFGLDWFRYMQIKKAVPKTFKINPYTRSKYDELKKIKKRVGRIYQNLATRHSALVHAQKMCKFPIQTKELQKAYSDLYIVTNITKYRDFQYRLLCGNIYTNDILYHWKKKDSQRCPWCNTPKQTVKHMLYDCIYSDKIWRNMVIFVNENGVGTLTYDSLSYEKIYLGTVTKPKDHLINFIVLVTKQHLFACNCTDTPISFIDVKEKLHWLYKIERYNAACNGNISKHEKKWLIKNTNSDDNISVNHVHDYLLHIQ